MIKKIAALCAIMWFRFLGLFIVLPVLSLYALEMSHANHMLVGLVVGGYALTQILFQTPLGYLSDKIGRKKTLIFGLIIFLIGSVICAYSNNIYILLLGRFLQGSGAISAVAIAMISDIVDEKNRSKAMAFIGISIGISFAISMTLGPFISSYFHIKGLFILVSIFCVISLILVVFFVPNPPQIKHENEDINYMKILKDKNLVILNITNFLQKSFMTLAFFLIPILSVKQYHWEKSELWKIYAPSMILAILAMGFSSVLGEKKQKSKEVLMLGILLFAISYMMFAFVVKIEFFVIGVCIFFIGFSIHEPLMQSLASKYSKSNQRGTTLGIFNSCGNLGTLTGALVGGVMMEHFSILHIGILVFVLCFIWVFLVLKLDNYKFFKIDYFKDTNLKDVKSLNQLEGIYEYYYIEEKQSLAVKYNIKKLSKEEISIFLKENFKS